MVIAVWGYCVFFCFGFFISEWGYLDIVLFVVGFFERGRGVCI